MRMDAPRILTAGIGVIAVVASLGMGFEPAVAASAATPTVPPGIPEFTRGMERQEGFLPLVWDAPRGRLLAEIAPSGEEFLYLTSSATGLGHPNVNVDLDRGSLVNQLLARFERVGPRVHLVARNARFRASGDSRSLARSVDESFPTSTLGAYEIVAESGPRMLVDLTPLFLADAVDVPASLRAAGQGSYALERERCRIHRERTRAFPRNTEVEAALTFTSDEPGNAIRPHVPDPRSITLRQHHSFVKLPEPGYVERGFDPRAGVFNVEHFDFARTYYQDPIRRLIVRHRLQKRDPAAAVSEPVQPIVYYLDPAVPEPYRTAFRDGALWWNRVFEAAGYRNALRVDDLGPEMDPMDARYHVIQWVHRSDPGPSVGSVLVDPRSGEILKAAVRMDSHRSLVDFDIYAALLPAMGKDAGSLDAEAEAFVMARRRQHAAHEVGHTLGFAHNFAAAADGRASVMAYPGPLILWSQDRPDLSAAYRDGPGLWDSLMVRYAYADFAPADEAAGLEGILGVARERGLRFATNPDEGPDGAYPAASVWVNGSDPVEELARMMTIRRAVIDRFDQRAIRPGEPMAGLGRRLAQAYLLHGHTLNAAIKAIGGMEFDYAVRGAGGPPTRIVSGARQRRALELALDGLEPRELAIPERVAVLMAPTPFGYETDPEAFRSPAAPAFDPLGAARALSAMTLGGILTPGRGARLAAQAVRDTTLPTLGDVVARIIRRAWEPATGAGPAALRRVVQREATDQLMRLAARADATPEVRAGAEWGLARIRERVMEPLAERASPAEAAHRAAIGRDIDRFLSRRIETIPAPAALPRRPWPALEGCSWNGMP